MTDNEIHNKKRSIRKEILNMLSVQKEVTRLRKSRLIQRKLFALQEIKKAKNIMFFASFDGEVETFKMIKEAMKLGKQVVLPLIFKKQKQIVPSKITNLKKELDIGPYGIRQPKPDNAKFIAPKELDLVVVPGVAFDRKGNRLGRGAGFYDSFLKSLPKRIPTVGLAFSFQILNTLPYIRHKDIPVDKVIFA